MKKLFLISFLFIFASSASASIYKWVDEKGVTHYSESPPPGKEARTINLQPPPPKEVTEQAIQELQEQELESEKRDTERQEAKQKKKAAEESARVEALNRQQRCIRARENLETLRIKRPVYRLDEHGNRVYFNDKERAAEMDRMKEEIANYCGDQ